MVEYVIARTNQKSYRNGFRGEDWQIAKCGYRKFPSGLQKCVIFRDGFACKMSDCEIK